MIIKSFKVNPLNTTEIVIPNCSSIAPLVIRGVGSEIMVWVLCDIYILNTSTLYLYIEPQFTDKEFEDVIQIKHKTLIKRYIGSIKNKYSESHFFYYEA